MSRPLIQKRVDELETMFETGQGNPDTLRLLEAELAFRSVPRASSLLTKVRRVLGGGAVQPSTKQNELFEHRPQSVVQTPLWLPPAISETPAAELPNRPKVSAASGEQISPMSHEEACKVLRVTAGASWEAIENARRQTVDRAHPAKLKSLPAGQRDALTLEAKRANAAYAVLSERNAG
jgi:hypothetical protein